MGLNKIKADLKEITKKVSEEYSKNPIIYSDVFSKEELEKVDAYNSKNYNDLLRQSLHCSKIFLENLKSANLNKSQEKVIEYLEKNDKITDEKVLFGTNLLPEKKVELKVDTKEIMTELRANLKKDLDNITKALESKDLSLFFKEQINSAITLEKIEDFCSKYKEIKEYKILFSQIEKISIKIYSLIEKDDRKH